MDWYSLEISSRVLLTHLADISVRATALALMAAALVPFLRRKPSAQHAMWTAVLIGMLTLPLLRPVVPWVHLAVPQRIAPHVSTGTRAVASAPVDPISDSALANNLEPIRFGLWWPLYLFVAYVAGAMWFGSRLIAGIWLTRRLWRGTRAIGREVAGLVAGTCIARDIGESAGVRVPLTLGLKRARVILPTEWRDWPVETLRVVLAHETAHVQRHDSSIALAAAVNKCVFWFHPLAWWLQRRLSVLAEHAADDTALAVSANPENYALVVLEIASRMRNQKSRLRWHGVAMNGPLVEKRIRRIMDAGHDCRVKRLGIPVRVLALSGATLLILLSAAVDFQSAAQARTMDAQLPMDGRAPIFYTNDEQPDSTTSGQAAEMELQLATNPEDNALREKLIRYYWRNKLQVQRIRLVLWLIDHHPDSPLHGCQIAGIFSRGPFGDAQHFEAARGRWLAQVSLHPDDPRVLWNASRVVSENSVREQLDLLKRARKVEPERGTEPLAFVYAYALIASTGSSIFENGLGDAVLAGQVKRELQDSTDIHLVGSVARDLVESATRKVFTRERNTWDFNALRPVAIELVSHAMLLEPQNREWSDLMEGAKRLGSSLLQPERAPAKTNAPNKTMPVVKVTRDGELFVNQQPVNINELAGIVKSRLRAQAIRLGADKEATWDSIVQVMTALRNANIYVNLAPPPPPPAPPVLIQPNTWDSILQVMTALGNANIYVNLAPPPPPPAPPVLIQPNVPPQNNR